MLSLSKDLSETLLSQPASIYRTNSLLKASILAILGNLLMLHSNLFARILFIEHPDISVPQFYSMRSTLELLTMLVFLNFNCKFYLYDIISFDMVPLIVLRATLIAAALFVVIDAIKYLPLTFVSLILATTPLWMTFMSYIVNKKRNSPVYIFLLVLSMIGVVIIIVGSLVDESERGVSYQDIKTYILIPFLLVILSPIIDSFNEIVFMRISVLGPYTMNAYAYLFGATLLFIYSLVIGENYDFVKRFEGWDYLMILAIGAFNCASNIIVAKALIIESRRRLLVYRYAVPFIQLMYDLVIFKFDFTVIHIIGMMVIYTANFLVLYHVY